MSATLTTSGTTGGTVVTAASAAGFIGYSSAATGAENYFAGTSALASVSGAATGNIVWGYLAGQFVSTGSYNVAIGYRAGRNSSGANGTGGFNTWIGYFAGTSCNTGVENTGLGVQALQALTTGTRNVGLGSNAAFSLTTAINNVAIGYQAGFTMTVAGTAITEPSVYVGYQAGKFATDGGNIAVGSGALAGSSSNTTSGSVAIGRNALAVSASAPFNTAVGDSAGTALTSGGSNTLIGRAAGKSITVAGYNVMAGHAAGFYWNGSATLTVPAGNTNGSNVFLGNSAGASLAAQQAATVMTGRVGVCIGEYCGPTIAAADWAICIGSYATVQASNQTKIGYLQSAANVSGNLVSTRSITAVTGATGQTFTASAMMGGIVTRSGGVVLSDTTATAAAIVASIPGCEVGSSYEFSILNGNTGTLTLTAATGITLGGTTSIAAGNTRVYVVLVTNATATTEAVTIQGMLTGVS